jgi:hypothetical protein
MRYGRQGADSHASGIVHLCVLQPRDTLEVDQVLCTSPAAAHLGQDIGAPGEKEGIAVRLAEQVERELQIVGTGILEILHDRRVALFIFS